MSLYLSQIDIDYAVAIKRHIRDAYNWHKKAWLAFPGRECEERDFLTRLDRRESDDQFRLLILSETKPTRPDWCPTDSWRTREVGASFLEHSCFQFSLLANPTKKVRVEAENGNRRKNGRRVALVTREERLAWLERKASESGFRIDPDKVRTVPRGREYFHKPGHRGTLSAVDFRGTLEVTDHDKFRDAFRRGIGSAKAFGFGMLVIAPIS
jgi:CRISPR system Cascade subunit CasE